MVRFDCEFSDAGPIFGLARTLTRGRVPSRKPMPIGERPHTDRRASDDVAERLVVL